MARLTPEEAAAKWAQRTAAATGDYQAGVERVNQAPGQKAAAKADKWLAGVQGGRDKFRDRVGAVSLSEWQRATVEKGAPRFAAGASAGEPKMAQFQREFLPHLDAVTNRVRAMPDNTMEQRLARMVEQARGAAQFRRGRGGGGGSRA